MTICIIFRFWWFVVIDPYDHHIIQCYPSSCIPVSCSHVHSCCSRVEDGHSCHSEVWWLSTPISVTIAERVSNYISKGLHPCLLFLNGIRYSPNQNKATNVLLKHSSTSSEDTTSTAVWQCEILFGMLLHWPSHFPPACWAASPFYIFPRRYLVARRFKAK